MRVVVEIVVSVALGLALVRFGLELLATACGRNLLEPAAHDSEDTFGF